MQRKTNEIIEPKKWLFQKKITDAYIIFRDMDKEKRSFAIARSR